MSINQKNMLRLNPMGTQIEFEKLSPEQQDIDVRVALMNKMKQLMNDSEGSKTFDVLVELAERATAMLGLDDERWVHVAVVDASNFRDARAYARVPTKRKIVLIPHCLRSVGACKAPIDEYGYHCMKCGACPVAEITRLAEEAGMKWYMVGGSSLAMKVFKKVMPRAVLGIACFDEIQLGLAKVLTYGISTHVVLLGKAGCVCTEVDIDEVAETLALEKVRKPRKTDH